MWAVCVTVAPSFKQTVFVHLHLQASEPSKISVESIVSVMFTPGREQQHSSWFRKDRIVGDM